MRLARLLPFPLATFAAVTISSLSRGVSLPVTLATAAIWSLIVLAFAWLIDWLDEQA